MICFSWINNFPIIMIITLKEMLCKYKINIENKIIYFFLFIVIIIIYFLIIRLIKNYYLF